MRIASTDERDNRGAECGRLEGGRGVAGKLVDLLARQTQDAILVLGPHGRVFFANRAVTDRFGPLEAGVPIDRLLEAVHPADRDGLAAALAPSADEPMRIIYRVNDAGGQWRSLESSAEGVRDAEGAAYVVVVTRDVFDERDSGAASRSAEERLRESEQRYRVLVESAPEGIIVHARGKILYCNAAAAELIGVESPEALLGTPVLDIVDPSSYEAVNAQIEWFRQHPGQHLTAEWRLRRRDGTVRQMLGSGGVITFRGQRAVQGVMRDITALREEEREKERLRVRLLQAQKMESLGVLAGGIAHDFNNLLAVIFANVRMAAQSESLGVADRAALADALNAAESGRLLTRQLLTYAGKQPTQPTLVDLSEHVKGLSVVLRSAVPAKVSFALELDPALSAVRADLAQLQQVTMNLVLNAVEAIGDAAGEVHLRTATRRLEKADAGALLGSEDLEPGEYVMLEVRDTGCGMDEKTQRQLFDPFFTTKDSGHGLGLSAVLGTVQSHRGGVSIESAPGRGTAIRVYLPAAGAAASRPAERPAEDLSGAGQVLVVDDDARLRRAARRMLESGGYQVAEAENGRQALDIFERMGDEIDLLLLDLHMPEMSGEEVLRELRRQHPALLVLVSSGFDDSSLAEGLADPAHTAFLPKPYTPDDLLAKVKALLTGPGESS